MSPCSSIVSVKVGCCYNLRYSGDGERARLAWLAGVAAARFGVVDFLGEGRFFCGDGVFCISFCFFGLSVNTFIFIEQELSSR